METPPLARIGRAEYRHRFMDSVFILSRGQRMGAILKALAKNLSEHYEVHVVIGGFPRRVNGKKELKWWADVPGLVLHDADKEYRQVLDGSALTDEFIDKIEKAIDLTSYTAASNYLIYRRFSREYYRSWTGLYDETDEIRIEYAGAYHFFSQAFQKYKPVLVFCETPDLISHRVAFAVAKRLGIFACATFFASPYKRNFAFLNFGTNNQNILFDLFRKRPELLTAESWSEADRLIQEYERKNIPKAGFVEQFRRKSLGFFPRHIKSEWPKLFNQPMLPMLKRETRKIKNKKWLNRHFRMSLPKAPYVLFLLHHQPEASTTLVAPRWVNQAAIAEQLAIHAPAGLRIVVKENPRTYGLRGEDYFGGLAKLPNLHLLHPAFDNSEALKNCLVVFSVAGTSGMEGILMRKKVAVLESVYYSSYPGARVLSYPDQLYKELEDPNWQPEKMTDELRTFAASYIQSCFELGESNEALWPPPETTGRTCANEIERFLSIVKREGLSVSDFPQIRT